MTVSVLLLTLNEEMNLPNFFKSLKWCDDIVVLDSYSEDKTIKIAKKNNARVYQRKFDNFADQRNYAIENISFKYNWILHLDADEIVTSKLYKEIIKSINENEYDAFKIPCKMMFNGKWLRYAGMYPVYQVRLGHYKKLRFVKYGHGQKEDPSIKNIGVIKEPYIHNVFSKGFLNWFDKHNKYSTEEAIENINFKKDNKNFDWLGIISLNDSRRRNFLKSISIYLPFRPSLRFIYMYFFRLGFLDGHKGMLYCRLLALYEKMIVIKIKIMIQQKKN